MRSDTDIIALWLHGRPKLTIQAYRLDIKQFLAFVGKPLGEVRLEDLQAFVTDLEQRGLKETTRSRKINAVKSLFQFATEQQHLAINPAASIHPPRHSSKLAGKILTRDEVDRIIAAAPSEKARIFLLTLYALALRASEACNLKWEDFVIRPDGRVQVTICGKGGKVASIVVPARVWVRLESLKRESSGDFVFGFDRRTGHNLIKQAVKAAGLNPKVSQHWLRHSFAVHALNAGAPIHVVRDSLRHSNVAVTNAYLETFPDQSASDWLEF